MFIIIRLGDGALNFEATTTEGSIDFHKWTGSMGSLDAPSSGLHSCLHGRTWQSGVVAIRIQ